MTNKLVMVTKTNNVIVQHHIGEDFGLCLYMGEEVHLTVCLYFGEDPMGARDARMEEHAMRQNLGGVVHVCTARENLGP